MCFGSRKGRGFKSRHPDHVRADQSTFLSSQRSPAWATPGASCAAGPWTPVCAIPVDAGHGFRFPGDSLRLKLTDIVDTGRGRNRDQAVEGLGAGLG